MKVALITDTHWGVRGDNVSFMDMSKRFLDTVFFPKLQAEGIKSVVHLGDLMDRRKFTNTYTAHRLDADFIKPMLSSGFEYHQILGNHDTYYKNTNEVNSVRSLYKDAFPIYDDAIEVRLHGCPVLFLPWICQENKDRSMEAIARSPSQICMGHLEIQGFEMYRGSVNDHGESRKTFDKFDLTLSGHFHHRSTDGSIYYLGSHGQFTWSDHDDSRGFHLLDLESRDLEFIENPYVMFEKVFYDDSKGVMEEVMDQDFESCAQKYVKVVVKNKTNPYWFDTFCGKIESSGCIDMQIVEDHLNLNLEDDSDIIDEAESTLDIFKKHISQVTSHTINTVKLNRLITDLYSHAMTLG